MNSRFSILTAMLILFASGIAVAGTYRWTDTDGNTHYSDTPVQGSEEVTVKVPGSDSPTPAAASTNPTPAPQDDQSQASPGASDAPPTANQGPQDPADIRAQQCALARKRLHTYQTVGTLYQQDDKGQKTEVRGDDRVNAIVTAQKDVQSYCSDSQAAQ